MNEIQITKLLVDKLEKSNKIRIIKTGFNLSGDEWFKSKWNEIHVNNQLVPPPIQLSPDIVYIDQHDKLVGIEVKKFKKKDQNEKSITRSFYDGIGQALVMLTWGYDHVGVWHIFEDTVDKEKRELYGTIWEILHNQLNVPIEFTYMLYDSEKDQFKPINRISLIENHKISLLTYNTLPIDDPGFTFTYSYTNPLLSQNPKVKDLRSILVNYLNR